MEQDSTQLLDDAEHTIAWLDATLDASIWWSRQHITRTDAAMLLCGFKPMSGDDPLRDSTEETTPEDYRRLLLIFGDHDDNQPLSAWLDIAKDAGLRVHSWLARYKDAKAILAIKTDGDAPQPTPTGKPAQSTASNTRRDGLAVAMEQGFDDYIKRHCREPTARALFDALAGEAGEGGQIVEYDEGDDSLTWRRQDGGLSSTSFKAFQGRFTKLKNRA